MKLHPVYLNGEWVVHEPATSVVNPATGETFARMSNLPRERIGQALECAHAAFAGWRQVPGKARGEFLERIAGELERRGDEVARLMTLENGKPLAQSLTEVTMSADHLRWFAGEARRSYGRLVPHQVEGKRHLVLKSPIGVVAAISPWNFPLMLGVRKVAPALAAGCAVVLKPARQTPLSAVAFAECVHTAQLPRGVFQLVQGNASEVGQEFLENPMCRKITFTGSTEVGRILIRGAAEQVKPLSLELGGQAPCLVFEDVDLGKAVDGVMMAKFRNSGQSCIAANRIFVQRPIYEEFLALLVARTEAMKVGDGLEEGMQIGPLIDAQAIAKAAQHVSDAVASGARLLTGGGVLKDRPGFFFQPTVLADVSLTNLCMCEETFAPIAPVRAFDTESEVLSMANASPFGLAAYAFTRDLSRAFRVMEGLDAGMIGLNDGVPTATQAPFGGVKQSGWGRELGIEGLDAFLDTKHVSIGVGLGG